MWRFKAIRTMSIAWSPPMNRFRATQICLRFVVALALFAPGCDVVHSLALTTIIEPHQFNVRKERRKRFTRHEQMAETAWSHFLETSDITVFSTDFHTGFIAGFVEQLRYGGTSEPPAIPPRKYWKDEYRTPNGLLAAKNWTDGFRTGAILAQADARRWETIDTAQQFVPDSPPLIIDPGSTQRPTP